MATAIPAKCFSRRALFQIFGSSPEAPLHSLGTPRPPGGGIKNPFAVGSVGSVFDSVRSVSRLVRLLDGV